ncbi:MAG: hypothetical protein DWQ00_14320, partial [Candidatus Scalindua sp.]
RKFLAFLLLAFGNVDIIHYVTTTYRNVLYRTIPILQGFLLLPRIHKPLQLLRLGISVQKLFSQNFCRIME